MQVRNIAIIAHVDHGKTTLVDGLLKQAKTFRENEAAFSQTLIMDSNALEKERGITILAKNTAVLYKDVKINIIDTPGHADFGGEVERTLNMADGALLIIDAQEGPMPQTKFVLKKALELGLKIIVIINKIDKKDSRVDEVIGEVNDLFLDLATDTGQLDFPIYYAIARDGKAWEDEPGDYNEKADLSPIFEAVLSYIPEPEVDEGKFQMLITAVDQDDFRGKYAIGRIKRGVVMPGLPVALISSHGKIEKTKVAQVLINNGLKKIETNRAEAGDIVSITGIKNARIGETVADLENPEKLPGIKVEEPTLSIAVSVNNSPFSGQEGEFVTGRQLLDRIKKELETNVSLRLEPGESNEYILSGRGELHLSVFIETLRREGFELQVGKPQIITKEVEGSVMEPVEEMTIDVETDKVGAVTSEVGRRKGVLMSQSAGAGNTSRLVFKITTRGLLGLRNQLMTLSKGTAVVNSVFISFVPMGPSIPKLRNGVLMASHAGKATSYGLNNAQGRGTTFIAPQTSVYPGMIIGLNSREEDLPINVTKEKKLTNVRAAAADDSIILTPPLKLSLEESLSMLEEDELLEVTPKNLRLRKKKLPR